MLTNIFRQNFRQWYLSHSRKEPGAIPKCHFLYKIRNLHILFRLPILGGSLVVNNLSDFPG